MTVSARKPLKFSIKVVAEGILYPRFTLGPNSGQDIIGAIGSNNISSQVGGEMQSVMLLL